MALGNLTAAGHSVLYVSGEESAAQIRLRAERLGERRARGSRRSPRPSLETVVATIEAERPEVCVIDSIQTMHAEGMTRRAGLGRPGPRGRGRADGGREARSTARSSSSAT